MASDLSGPGCLHVESKISRPDILDEGTYSKWYEEEHIAEVTSTSGIRSSRRFKDVNPDADKPYLALYPLDDLGFLKSDEFRKIGVKSDTLPGTGLIYDLAEVDVSYNNIIQIYDPTKKGKGHIQGLITAQMELKKDTDVDDFEKWYREEHIPLLSKTPGYLRSTRFRLAYARTNAQSRALKGLPPREGDRPPEATAIPTWLALHEFEVQNPDLNTAIALSKSPWTDKILAGTEVGIFRVYNLMREFGERDWFYGKE